MNALEVGTYKVRKEDFPLLRDADALIRHGELAKAEACFLQVQKNNPTFISVYHNIAALRDMQGKEEDVEEVYEEALKIDPNDVMTHHFYGLLLLSKGKLKQGWEHYKWRVLRSPKAIPQMYGVLSPPFWKGEPLLGRHIVVWTEQGIGDEILLASMFKDLIATGCKLSIICSDRVQRLFETSFQQADVYSRTEAMQFGKAFIADYQASLVELGMYLRPDINSLKGNLPFLNVRDTDVWKIGTEGKPSVGISWLTTNEVTIHEKSIDLAKWLPILQTPGITFVSLQHGIDALDVFNFNRKYGTSLIYVNAVNDVDKLAGLIEGLDLVISISNTNVHLAGGLGKTVWALLPEGKGRMWYWFRHRKDCPWYHDVSLFRRKKDGDENLLKGLASKLRYKFKLPEVKV